MKHTTAITLALLVLLPFVSAAINAGTGAPPVEDARATSVQVLSFGNNAMICVNCQPLTSETEPGLASSTLASYMPRVTCKGDTPCVIYTGLKYKGELNPESEYPFIIATKDAYNKDKPVMASSGQNVRMEDVSGDIVDTEGMNIYTVENPKKIILQNAKVYINNLPVGTETPLAGTLSNAEQEHAESIRVTEEEKGQILKIRGLDKRAPNQLIGEFSIPLKKGDTITFKGLFGEKEYSLEQPVLNIGRFTDNEDDSTAEDEDAEDWLDELDSKFLDSSKDRSELQICNKKFVNYYAGSAFELKANEGRCEITEYFINTELFEEDDIEDKKLFAYVCGDIVYEAVGGDVKNMYCNQADIHNALLSCGKDGNDAECTGVNGKTRIKVRIEPGAFDIDNTQGYMFKSINEIISEEQKAYSFVTGKLKIRTHPQSENPLRYDLVLNNGNEPLIVTYKDTTALGASTITLPENTVVSRIRGAQLFSYILKKADYKGVLGEGLHQINLIYPEGLERNEETSTAIRESKTRGATRDNIALLGAVAEERIEVSSPSTHLYTVTPSSITVENAAAVTTTPSVIVGEAQTLGEYAYRYCWRSDPPSPFTGRQRDAARQIAIRLANNNPDALEYNAQDIMETPVPAGTVLLAPNTITSYRAGNSVVNIRLAPEGCVVPLSAPAIQGEQCMEKPGAVVKCVPPNMESQCINLYNPGEGVKECIENGFCCEVRQAQAGEYCVLPEAGRAFLPNGAKCSARCGSEVSNADYGRIDVERVTHCAEGLKCCKSEASTGRTTSRGDDSACTRTGGKCADMRSTVCFNEELNNFVSFVPGKCKSNKASWYQCCPSGVLQGTSSDFYPETIETEEACTSANGQCRARCGVGERAGTEEQSAECEGKTAIVGGAVMQTNICCVPA
ncbi:MAG: hypothetical protein PHO02_01510 [Candidatus Nanoarchaeia archaeon]|nr:hypothetical protein [Candidatus Nanoarchaeia archaeon]